MGDAAFNLTKVLAAEKVVEPGYWGVMLYLGLTLLIIFVLASLARAGLKERVFKNPITQASEQMYLFIENMCVGTIGPHGRKYIPFIGGFWLVIFTGNAVALFFPSAPTADISFNLAMAMIAVFYVQYEGIKSHADGYRARGADPVTASVKGFFKHLSHFAGPKLGWAYIPITLMIFCIEIVSELMKNVSLSLRLFGNINGGHQAVEAMNRLGGNWVPVGGLLLLIKLLTVVVQALIFTLLTCVYLSLVTHHDEEHSHEGGVVPAPAH